MPPRAIVMTRERVGVGPAREERGVGGLGVDDGGFKVSCHQGTEEKVVGEGENAFVVMGSSVMIGVAGKGVSTIGCARLVNQANIVVA